ncbi:MAG: hypothetical protein IOD08_20635, partial [Bradyrhizobium sp.]|nr:hypothetical protein [Bradyrhizobium sp.]
MQKAHRRAFGSIFAFCRAAGCLRGYNLTLRFLVAVLRATRVWNAMHVHVVERFRFSCLQRVAVILALLVAFGTGAHAQTVLNAGDGASLVTALTTIDNNPGASYTLNITQNITLTSGTTLPIINSRGTVTINGGNFTLDGGGVQRGLFVYSGTVAVNNLTIQNAVA